MLAPGGEVLVGYVGRLAAEKRVDLLAEVSTLPGVRLVVVGDGPHAGRLRAALPRAVFLGQLSGEHLGRTMASLDVFAHTGSNETFCQSVQEALAAAAPPSVRMRTWAALTDELMGHYAAVAAQRSEAQRSGTPSLVGHP